MTSRSSRKQPGNILDILYLITGPLEKGFYTGYFSNCSPRYGFPACRSRDEAVCVVETDVLLWFPEASLSLKHQQELLTDGSSATTLLSPHK